MSDTLKTLPKFWSEYLVSKPETGVGYQVVAVTLKDGKRIEDVAIVQSSLIAEVRGCDEVSFEPEEIESLELTHRKWKFRN
jgi:hypothetical protein